MHFWKNRDLAIILGVIFLWTVSSLMVMSTVTVYHETVLHISKTKLGSIQGIANLSAYVAKFIFGIMTDIFHNFRSVLVFGSILTLISKPLFAYASSYESVFYLRSGERLTQGIRKAPTDSYISFVEKQAGHAFGLKQVAITTGALLGCLLASLILYTTGNNFKLLFQLSAIPTLLATLMLIFLLKNPKQFSLEKKRSRGTSFNFKEILKVPPILWYVFFLVFVTMTCRFGETFFLGHRFFEAGTPMHFLPLSYIYYDLPFAFTSFYMIRFLDTADWRKIFLISIICLNLAHFCMFISNSYYVLIAGAVLGGIHMGTSQGLFLTMVSKHTPPDIRGTVFAVLYTIMGLGFYAAGKIAGVLGQTYGTWKASFGGGFIITGILFFIVLASCFVGQRKKA